MIAAPRQLAGKRRAFVMLLVATALGEAVLAVQFAAALERLLAETQAPVLPLLAAAGCAAMIAASLLSVHWACEDFAQSEIEPRA